MFFTFQDNNNHQHIVSHNQAQSQHPYGMDQTFHTPSFGDEDFNIPNYGHQTSNLEHHHQYQMPAGQQNQYQPWHHDMYGQHLGQPYPSGGSSYQPGIQNNQPQMQGQPLQPNQMQQLPQHGSYIGHQSPAEPHRSLPHENGTSEDSDDTIPVSGKTTLF